MITHTYTQGLTAGRKERARIVCDGEAFTPTYVNARAAVREYAYTPVMSDKLLSAHRRSRAWAIGYLRGLRGEETKAMYRDTFTTPYTQHANRRGQAFKVLSIIDEPDQQHSEEVLPMYLIQFSDGTEIEAWPEEVLS